MLTVPQAASHAARLAAAACRRPPWSPPQAARARRRGRGGRAPRPGPPGLCSSSTAPPRSRRPAARVRCPVGAFSRSLPRRRLTPAALRDAVEHHAQQDDRDARRQALAEAAALREPRHHVEAERPAPRPGRQPRPSTSTKMTPWLAASSSARRAIGSCTFDDHLPRFEPDEWPPRRPSATPRGSASTSRMTAGGGVDDRGHDAGEAAGAEQRQGRQQVDERRHRLGGVQERPHDRATPAVCGRSRRRAAMPDRHRENGRHE